MENNSLESIRQQLALGRISVCMALANILEGEEKKKALEFLLVEFIKKGDQQEYRQWADHILELMGRQLTNEEAVELFDVINAKSKESYNLASILPHMSPSDQWLRIEPLLQKSLICLDLFTIQVSLNFLKRQLTDDEKQLIIKNALASPQGYLKFPDIITLLELKTEILELFFEQAIKERNYPSARELANQEKNEEKKKMLLERLWNILKETHYLQTIEQLALDLKRSEETTQIFLEIFKQYLNKNAYADAESLATNFLSEKSKELKEEIFQKVLEEGDFNLAEKYKLKPLTKDQLGTLLQKALVKEDHQNIRIISFSINKLID